jgi:O-antigen/teichoic acid export membrane protein
VAFFKPVQGLVRLALGAFSYVNAYSTRMFLKPAWWAMWQVFQTATVFALIEILGIIYNKTNIFFLERVTGVEGVARYSATYNLVDPISVLGSEQLLAMVIFPVLSTLWWKDRVEAGALVRRTAQWLLAIAFPIMFFLSAESDLIIGLIYPGAYRDAVWMQRYLVWTILLSFENNLFAYVMMAAGAARTLLIFAAITTTLNLICNVALVGPFGLAGGCVVLILTKLSNTALTLLYCHMRFGLFRWTDFVFPVVVGVVSLLICFLIEPVTGHHSAVLLTIGVYLVLLWQPGMRFLGPFPSGPPDRSTQRQP